MLLCDTSSNKPRPLVPPGFQRHVFDLIHNLSHPSARASQKLISERFVWHRMNADIAQWCRECVACQTSKVHRHHRSSVEPIPVPGRRFSHVHVDIVGPLPLSAGFSYLLTAIDRTTRWPEAYPLTDITASTCAQAFLSGWVARFGVPLELTTDCGRQFTSSLWSAMATALGTSLHRTTSYHPQSNGLVERFHRSLKASLKARLNGPDWMQELPWVMLGLHATPKSDLNCSPAELVFGDTLSLPGEFIEHCYLKFRPRTPPGTHQTAHHNTPSFSTPLTPLLTSPYVFVRCGPTKGPLQRPYDGPFKVIEPGTKRFIVRVKGKSETISVDRLKPAHGTTACNSRPGVTAPTTVIVTHSGRAVKRPARYCQ